MKSQVTIGLIGIGTIGSGTYQLIRDHRADVEARMGAKIRVKTVCSLLPKRPSFLGRDVIYTKDWKKVVFDPDIDCVVELIGGLEPARTIVLSALRSGKHVVTANKAILSKFWNEIFNTAHKTKTLVYFEAAVGGGIPVIQALNEGLAANHIKKIVGILNGTTNFILTRMQETAMNFKDALKEARAAGFAEANPTFDIEGIDAAQKISILGSLATGRWVAPEKVYSEGISKLQALDIRLIEEILHSRVKLLGIAEEGPHGWVFRVHPTLISHSHPFSNVRNEYNAISLHGDPVGDVMLYGKGAGKRPTSSAVVSDIIFLCRQIANGTAGQLPYVSVQSHRSVKIGMMKDVRCRYYLRVTTVDKPGILSRITGILGENGVSIASVHQDAFENTNGRRGVPVVLVTHQSREADVQTSVRALDRLTSTTSRTVLLRME